MGVLLVDRAMWFAAAADHCHFTPLVHTHTLKYYTRIDKWVKFGYLDPVQVETWKRTSGIVTPGIVWRKKKKTEICRGEGQVERSWTGRLKKICLMKANEPGLERERYTR